MKRPSSQVVYRVDIRVAPLQPLQLPRFAASMFRGAIGHALHDRYCNCDAVDQHQPDCLYRTLFEGVPASGRARFQDVPPPFTLGVRVPDEVRCVQGHYPIRAGQSLTLQLLLLGPAARHAPRWLEALQLALARGLGNARVPAEIRGLEEVPLRVRGLPEHPRLQLLTPLQLKHNRRLVGPQELSPEALLMGIARRVDLVRETYDLPLQAVDFRALKTAATKVQLSHDTRLVRWQRYSNRQQTHAPLQGLLGRIQLDIPEHLRAGLSMPLLWGQWLHAGRKAGLGLGAYRMFDGFESTTRGADRTQNQNSEGAPDDGLRLSV